jgi:hypothetical protein
MSDVLKRLLEPNPAFTGQISTAYEFSHVAAANGSTPRLVVFINDINKLSIPVSKFQWGEYEEWKNQNVLPSQEVGRAAAALFQSP